MVFDCCSVHLLEKLENSMTVTVVAFFPYAEWDPTKNIIEDYNVSFYIIKYALQTKTNYISLIRSILEI